MNDDQDFIAASLGGQPQAFGTLVQRYQDRLYGTVFRLVDNQEVAFDVVQATFIHAYTRLGKFKGDSPFFTWLNRIAVNEAIQRKRRRFGE